MKKINKILAALFVTMALAIGISAVVPAPPAEAAALTARAHALTSRPLWLYTSFNGQGDSDVIFAGEWTELSYVVSVWVPARCALQINGVTVERKINRGRYHNLIRNYAYVRLRLNC